jgi:Leucine-rich repeat (LRR) protein
MPLLESLNLTKNLVQSLLGLENVPKLRDIKLRGNNVEKFEDEETLPELPSLEVLNLRECQITTL